MYISCHERVDYSYPTGNTTKSISGDGSGMLCSNSIQVEQQNQTCHNITCRDGFYLKETLIANDSVFLCYPSCYTWKQHASLPNFVIDFLVLLSACIGVVSGVGVLVVAGIRWKNVYACMYYNIIGRLLH